MHSSLKVLAIAVNDVTDFRFYVSSSSNLALIPFPVIQ